MTPTTGASPAPDPDYIIDDIMPAHEIHLMGGPSGAGKTTLTFQLLQDLEQGKPIFGKASHPVPVCYIACDRSMAGTQRTLNRLQITPNFPIISLTSLGLKSHDYNLRNVLNIAKQRVPNARLLVVDAIAAITPDGKVNDYRKVQDMLTEGAGLCEREHLTVLGLGHTTKTKEGEEFKNPRQRFLGSVAWGGISETMFYIEPTDPSNPTDPTRRVMVLSKNSASIVVDYALDNRGKLVPIEEHNGNFVLDVCLLNIEPGKILQTSEIVGWAGNSISKRTVERWIETQIDSGRLERLQKKGTVRRTNPS